MCNISHVSSACLRKFMFSALMLTKFCIICTYCETHAKLNVELTVMIESCLSYYGSEGAGFSHILQH